MRLYPCLCKERCQLEYRKSSINPPPPPLGWAIKSGKAQLQEVGDHLAKDQKQIRTSSW